MLCLCSSVPMGLTWLFLPLAQVLFTPATQAARQAACTIVEALATIPSRKQQVLDLLTRYCCAATAGSSTSVCLQFQSESLPSCSFSHTSPLCTCSSGVFLSSVFQFNWLGGCGFRESWGLLPGNELLQSVPFPEVRISCSTLPLPLQWQNNGVNSVPAAVT